MKESFGTVTATSHSPTFTSAWRALALASMLCTVFGSVARADAVLLLPPSGDETLRAAQERAQAELQRALIQQGMREGARSCKAVDCAATLMREVGADQAVGLAVWSSDVNQTVFVTIVGERGNRFPGRAFVHDGDVVTATNAALLDARALALLGPGPWLRVHGKPEGAEVVLSGQVIGTVPMRKKVASGRHVLEVRKEGHKTFVQSVDVPPNASKQVDVEVSLLARPMAGDDPSLTALDQADGPSGVERSSAWSFVLGGVLAAVGAGALTYGIVTLTQDGDCEERDEMGRCRKEKQAGTLTTVALVGGGAALVGSAVMFIVQPIQTESGETALLATVRGRM